MNGIKRISTLCLAALMFVGCHPKEESKPAPEPQTDLAKADEGNAEAKADESNAEAKADDAKAEAKADEGNAETKADDGKAEVKADDGKAEVKADEEKGRARSANDSGRKTAEYGSLIRLDKLYGYDDPSWELKTCEDAEGCDCAGFKCPMNAVCHGDHFCTCGDTVLEQTEDNPYDGYICMEIAKGVYGLGCTERDGCQCGKVKVYSNMGCNGKNGTCVGSPVPGRGLSCSHKPYENWFYSLNCFNEECDCYGETIHKGEVCPPLVCERGFEPSVIGCACNGHKDDGKSVCVIGRDETKVSYCTSEDGCECGDATCPKGAVCRHKKCVDRATFKDIPDGYDISMGVPRCTEETCACGKKGQCQNGKYCLNGICYSNPYTKKFSDGKTLYYHIFDKEIVDAGPKEQYRNDLWSLLFIDSEYRSDNSIKRYICDLFDSVKVKGSEEDVCKSDQASELLVGDVLRRCGTGEVPENVATMFCTLDVEDGALVFSGWQSEE